MKKKVGIGLLVGLGLIVIAAVLSVRFFQEPSSSMEPTYGAGDSVVAVRLWFGDPGRGDVLVFHPNGKGNDPFETNRAADPYLVKRLIGLPNEVVGSHDGKVYVCADGRVPADPSSPTTTPGCRFLDEPYVHGLPTFSCDGPGDYQVPIPPDHYLMLGDNRTNSLDGRCYGTIPRSQIVALVVASH